MTAILTILILFWLIGVFINYGNLSWRRYNNFEEWYGSLGWSCIWPWNLWKWMGEPRQTFRERGARVN